MRRLFSFFLGGKNWNAAYYGNFLNTTESRANENELHVIPRIELRFYIYCRDSNCPHNLLNQFI